MRARLIGFERVSRVVGEACDTVLEKDEASGKKHDGLTQGDHFIFALEKAIKQPVLRFLIILDTKAELPGLSFVPGDGPQMPLTPSVA